MWVLTLATQKGGTGKSALAVSLAVTAEAAGEQVCILDLDPQGTSASWYEARAAETPAVLDHDQAGQISETLVRLRAAGYTLAILDTPGIDSHATRGAMREANLTLVPVRPSEADVKATMPTVRALEAMGRPYALLINQAPTNRQARLTAAVGLRLSTSGEVVPVPVAARIDHQYAYALGQGVHEYAPEGKAAAEVAQVWMWCKKRMESEHDKKGQPRA
ncbi:chromosome partitioning protein [Methylobacterium sp. RAS18]|nr:chromosome partitioning protein [Methylobacterium sp. RAS18]